MLKAPPTRPVLILATAALTCFVSTSLVHAAFVVSSATYHSYEDDSQGANTTSPFAEQFGSLTQQDPDGGVGESTSLYDFRGLTAAPVAEGEAYFFLEDVHDGQFDTPGVTITGLQPRTNDGRNGSQANASFTDSVDEDDGAVDGLYSNPKGGFRITSGEIRFTFDEGILGALPTHVGIVFAERTNVNFSLSAYDADDNLVGAGGGPFNYADPFLGVIALDGISYFITTGEAEYDHLQYGRPATEDPFFIPEPSTATLYLVGLAIIGCLRKRSIFNLITN